MADDPELFDAAMERPPADRERAVRLACGDDFRRAARLIELVRVATDAELSAARLPVEHLRRGATYGRYCVVSLIGEGSFGHVYDALDLELDRRVALKLLHHDRAQSEDDERRFRREAKALARIDHPNVVRVYDAGVEGNRRFLSMELIQGPSFREWMQSDSRRGWAEVLGRLLPAARGLAAAHAAGIVHRDFKPENVLIDEVRDRVVVADFGIARGHEPTERATTSERPDSGPTSSNTFETHSTIGTPGYMAPEQWCGEASPKSDQFAFCRTMLEAMGCPGRATQLPTTSNGAGRPAEPIPNLDRRMPRALWKVLARGTAAEPQERHADMAALVTALRQVQRHRRWTHIGLVTAVLAVPAGYAIARTNPAPCEIWNARAAAEELEPQWVSLESTSMSEPAAAVRRQFRGRAETGLQRWATARRDSCLQHASGLIDRDTAQARDQCFGRWRQQLDQRVRWATQHPKVLASPRFSEMTPRDPDRCAYVTAIPGADEALESDVRASLGRGIEDAERLWVEGQYDESRTAANQALATARDVGHEGHTADALLQLGILAARRGEPEQATEILFEGLELAQRQAQDPLVFSLEFHLAETLLVGGGGAPTGAATLLMLARAQLSRMGDRPYLRAELRVLEGHLAQREREFEKAQSAYIEAARLFDTLDGGALGAAAARDHVAEMLSVGGAHGEAVEIVDRAFQARMATLGGPNHPLLVGARLRAAAVHLRAAKAATNRAARSRRITSSRAYVNAALKQAALVHGVPSGPVVRGLTLSTNLALVEGKVGPSVAQDATEVVEAIEALDEDMLSFAHRVEGLRVARNVFHNVSRWEDALEASSQLVDAHRSALPALSFEARDDELYLISYLAQAGETDIARQRLRRHEALYAPSFAGDPDYAANLERLHQGLEASATTESPNDEQAQRSPHHPDGSPATLDGF